MVFLSVPVVALLLNCHWWEGDTTWFGNKKYPLPIRHSSITDITSKWQAWVFYCARNPVSNFGHTVLANSQPWAWEYTDYKIGFLTFNFGWKLNQEHMDQTFKFRPRLTKE